MKPVLFRTLGLTLVAVIINYFAYQTTNRSLHKEGIMIMSVVSIILAVPMILGYIVSYNLSIYRNSFLVAINWLLFIFNGLALLICSGLGLVSVSQSFKFFFPLLFLIGGWYVYVESIFTFNKHRKDISLYSDTDVLDDNWI